MSKKMIYTPAEVFRHVLPHTCRKTRVDFDGDKIKVGSDRLILFKTNTTCVCCGREGTYFRKTLNGDGKTYHFNLYSQDGILMTKDHIFPKSKGGKDVQSNYQTMCEPCNVKKGDKI